MLIEDILFTHLLLRLKRAWWGGKRDRKRKRMEAGGPGLPVYLYPLSPKAVQGAVSPTHSGLGFSGQV